MIATTFLPTFALLVCLAVTSAQFDFEWDKPCYDECSCNDVAKYVTCYKPATSDPQSFIDLSFNRANRTFTKLFFVDYAQLPAASFRDVSFAMNGTPSSPNRVLISLKSPRKIASDAFSPISAAFDNRINLLDIDMLTPIDLEVAPGAFNGLKAGSLKIFDIKLSKDYENRTFTFNFYAFYGASEINYLKFERNPAISAFDSQLPVPGPVLESLKVLINELEITETNISQITNRTLSGDIFKIQQLKALTWTSSQLEFIEDYTFSQMSSLGQLFLTANQLKAITSNTLAFGANNSLQILDLTSNPISRIENGSFKSLTKLKQLSLAATGLKQMSNFLNGTPTLEVLNFGRQRALESVNWAYLDKTNAPGLKNVDLSYMNSSRVVFNFSLIAADYQYSLAVARSFGRFARLQLYGYEFAELEENSFCVFRPFQMDAELRKANMTRIYLNLNHPCSCFPILAFKYYRELNGYDAINSSLEFLNDAPRCLKDLYRNVSDVVEREAACESLYLARCVRTDPPQTTTSQPTATSSIQITTTAKERDNALIAIIVSSSIGAVCIILMLVLIFTVCRLNYRKKLSSQEKSLNNIEKKTQEIEQSFEQYRKTYSQRMRAHQLQDRQYDSDSAADEIAETRVRKSGKKRAERKKNAGQSSKRKDEKGPSNIETVPSRVEMTSF